MVFQLGRLKHGSKFRRARPGPTSPYTVSGHLKPASNGRNDPATVTCASRHFSSEQARCNWFVSGLFERKMPFHSSSLTQNSLAGSFRPFVAGLISTDDITPPVLAGLNLPLREALLINAE